MNTYTITCLDDPEAQAFFVSCDDRIIDSFDTYAEAEAFIIEQMRAELLRFAIEHTEKIKRWKAGILESRMRYAQQFKK